MGNTTIAVAAALLLLAAGLFGHMRKLEAYRAPELAAGYRGLVMRFSPEELAWVKQGDSLDVISVFDAVMKTGAKEKVAATLLQNVKVAGVNPRRGTVVMLVNPNEAQYLALALFQGEVRLSLRAAGDKQMAPMEIASYRRLIR